MPPRKTINPPGNQTILLDIFERIGRVETQNDAILKEQARAADGRSKLYQSQDEIIRRLDRIDGTRGLVDRVTAMEPHIETWRYFRSQLALAALGISSLISGAATLIWMTLTHLGEIREAMRNVLAWIMLKT